MEEIEQGLEEAYKDWLLDKEIIVNGLNDLILEAKCGKLTYIEPEMCERIIDFIERSRF